MLTLVCLCIDLKYLKIIRTDNELSSVDRPSLLSVSNLMIATWADVEKDDFAI